MDNIRGLLFRDACKVEEHSIGKMVRYTKENIAIIVNMVGENISLRMEKPLKEIGKMVFEMETATSQTN
jgi:hypothetical protein